MSNELPFGKYDGDIYLYYGPINRDGYHQLSQLFEDKQEKQKKVCLVLVTSGGDPDAGYRIARATNHHYDEFEILIPDICKSAGTLVCIGANKLIFGDRGELGPLDIQLSKPDEMFENMSGLDIMQAISVLEEQLLFSFRKAFVDIRAGSRITTKTAAEIATKLVDGFISPITSRIDPITLGEHQRAILIASDYGERLNEMVSSLNDGALASLVGGYPSHGFVIDRKEAKTLFKNVSAPDEETAGIYKLARNIIEREEYPSRPVIIDVIEFINKLNESQPEEKKSEETVPDVGGEETDRQGCNQHANDESQGDEQNSVFQQPHEEKNQHSRRDRSGQQEDEGSHDKKPIKNLT